jgi:hypothetical protein
LKKQLLSVETFIVKNDKGGTNKKRLETQAFFK